MSKPKEPFNPFYIPLLLAGIAFFVTACAYGVMMHQTSRSYALEDAATENRLLPFLNEHGLTLMVGELVVLALATVGTIALDHVRWTRRHRAEQAAAAEAGDQPSS